MSESMSKQQFLDTLQQVRAVWEALLAQVAESQMEQSGVVGEWSLKDILAHVSWHEREMVGLVRAGALVGSDLWQRPLDERNQVLFEENRHRPLAEVLAEAKESFEQLWEVLQTVPEAALLDSSHFRGMPADWTPWKVIASNSYEHYLDHLEEVRRWLERIQPEAGVTSDPTRVGLFDQWASGYDASLSLNDFPFDGYDVVLDEIVQSAQVQPAMCILDLGIGTGNLAQRFVSQGCTVWGTDFSRAMLAEAKAKLPEVHLVQVDLFAEWPAELQQRFDRIVSAYVLHEFDLERKIELLQRLSTQHLAEGGRIVIGDIAFPTLQARELAHQQWSDRWDEEESYWAADEAQVACERAGLRLDYRQISSCGGVFVIIPSASERTG